jgi:hypothetical protein
MTRPTLIRVHQYGRGAPSLPDAGPAWLSSPNRGCADTDPDLFFSDSVADQNKALSICEQTCPFLSACDEYATQRQEKFGVWGGKLRSSGSKIKPVTADPGQPAPASEPEEAEEPVTVDIDRLLRSNSGMDFSPQQAEAITKITDWYANSDQQVFRLFGYAGTGKTTLARHIVDQLGVRALFAAFTGKAAYVLRTKGCDGARTIHSLIYQPVEKVRARLNELERKLDAEIDPVERGRCEHGPSPSKRRSCTPPTSSSVKTRNSMGRRCSSSTRCPWSVSASPRTCSLTA